MHSLNRHYDPVAAPTRYRAHSQQACTKHDIHGCWLLRKQWKAETEVVNKWLF